MIIEVNIILKFNKVTVAHLIYHADKRMVDSGHACAQHKMPEGFFLNCVPVPYYLHGANDAKTSKARCHQPIGHKVNKPCY